MSRDLWSLDVLVPINGSLIDNGPSSWELNPAAASTRPNCSKLRIIAGLSKQKISHQRSPPLHQAKHRTCKIFGWFAILIGVYLCLGSLKAKGMTEKNVCRKLDSVKAAFSVYKRQQFPNGLLAKNVTIYRRTSSVHLHIGQHVYIQTPFKFGDIFDLDPLLTPSKHKHTCPTNLGNSIYSTSVDSTYSALNWNNTSISLHETSTLMRSIQNGSVVRTKWETLTFFCSFTQHGDNWNNVLKFKNSSKFREFWNNCIERCQSN